MRTYLFTFKSTAFIILSNNEVCTFREVIKELDTNDFILAIDKEIKDYKRNDH